MVLPVTIEENLTFLAKWQKIFDGNSLVYDYPLGRAHYGDFGYVSISKVLAGDIHHVKNLHLDGYISCQELRAFLPNGLPNYVMGYLTLDTEESFDSLMDEYFQAAYGSMADEVKEYLTRISQRQTAITLTTSVPEPILLLPGNTSSFLITCPAQQKTF